MRTSVAASAFGAARPVPIIVAAIMLATPMRIGCNFIIRFPLCKVRFCIGRSDVPYLSMGVWPFHDAKNSKMLEIELKVAPFLHY